MFGQAIIDHFVNINPYKKCDAKEIDEGFSSIDCKRLHVDICYRKSLVALLGLE
jgi:hypothetical protein